MKNFLANWKTSAAGAAAILGAVADVLTQASTRSWSMERLVADFAAASAGVGLIFAKDGNVTGGSVRQ